MNKCPFTLINPKNDFECTIQCAWYNKEADECVVVSICKNLIKPEYSCDESHRHYPEGTLDEKIVRKLKEKNYHDKMGN